MAINKDRIQSNIKKLSAYTVPEIDCSVKLDGNESPYSLEDELSEKVCAKLQDVELNRYPDPNMNSVRSRLGELYSFPKDGILLGNGSDEIIQILVTVFTGKSETVLVPKPTFSMYRLSSLAQNKTVIESRLDENFDIDIEDFKNMIIEYDPDLIFLATPNNPTGNSFSENKIFEILNTTDAIVVVDEAYFEFATKTFLPLVSDFDNLMVLRTMSKIGFASIRLGFLFGNPELISELHKARMPYNINSLTQSVMKVALENTNVINEKIELIISEREKLGIELKKIAGIEVYPSDANFFLMKVDDADFVFSELVKKDILIRNLNGEGRLKNCIRITVGTPSENEKLLDALTSVFSN